ncbi:MAG TPA: serine/threonine-protein kinase [Polyangiaceae bacterium]|jgi:serine/threonine-protein kinase|nr:serine/threonine-protein kinase [Polyangiaceae bacterium]
MTLLAGKYRLSRVIGQGGMGVVVVATHAQLDERVAIKLLLPEALQNAETVARFQREARAAVRIKSEHVARVIDVGTVDYDPHVGAQLQAELGVPLAPGAPFMVMEYLEGQDLSGVLRASGPLSVADAVAYLAQAIEAIAEAHSLGIIHRDLKPSNLFLTRRPDGTPLVKVLDFGISKANGPNMTDAGMTTTSAVLGSPMYMAPEQMIASREVDGRTDVWSLGVVLYQLLTGRGPFNGTTMTELCARILQEPHAPMRATRPDVPFELETVVARCLEKDRVRRFASVADLAEAIAPFGGQGAAMSAERARRLIPRTERASAIPHVTPAQPLPATMVAMPYAATNPSWSATRARAPSASGSGSGMWIALALGAAGIIVAAAVVILFLALNARGSSSSSATPQVIEAEHTAVPAVTATVAPQEELAPLRPLGATTQQQQQTTPPTVHTTTVTHPPPAMTTTHAQNPPNPPPTQTQSKPDIF